MKLGPVRWHLKKQGVFELSADKSRLVIGDKIDSTISVVDVETGQVVRTLEQQFHRFHVPTGKFTNLIIDEHGQHIAINSYQSDVDSIGWVIVRVEDGVTLTSRVEPYFVRAFSTLRDRVVVYDIGAGATGRSAIRRLSDNTVIKNLEISGWSEYEEATGRLFVVADRVIRAFDIISGDEIGQWGVEKSDMISKDQRSDWIYASTRISSGDERDLNLVECVNISTNERRTFAADAFAGDCPQCLELGRIHDWSSSAESSFLIGLLRPGQYNVMWRVNALDSSVRIWLNPRFYYKGRPVYHDAVYLEESSRYIHMFGGNLDSGGIWCRDVVPNTTSIPLVNEERDRIEVVDQELLVHQSGSCDPITSIAVSSIDGRVRLRHDVDANAEVPTRIPIGSHATGLYLCTITRVGHATTQTFTVIR